MCIPGLHDDDTETVEETMPVAKRKEKRRNTEKRKERSRDAARSRRSKEAEYFSDLASLLPYPESLVAHLDKASIMRLSITYLKLKSFVDCALPESGTPSISDSPWSSPLRLDVENFALCDTGPDHVSGLVSLLFIVSSDGEIIYVSENVSDQLGLLQVDLLGGSVFDYVHPCDHDEFRANLSFCTERTPGTGVGNAKTPDVLEQSLEDEGLRDEQKIFSVRVKCNTASNKNRTGTSRPSNHKVLHCTGRLIVNPFRERATPDTTEELSDMDDLFDDDSDGSGDDEKSRHPSSSGMSSTSSKSRKFMKPHLVFIAEPLEKSGASDFLYQKGSFHSRHSLNMKFTDVCESVSTILGYSKDDLIGKSVFDFHHILDAVHLEKTFKTLFQKGHCRTNHYRMLGKTGGYAWAITEATLVNGRKSQKPESVSCHTVIISGLEHAEEVISVHQLEWSGGAQRESVALHHHHHQHHHEDDDDDVVDEDADDGTKDEPPDFPLDLDPTPAVPVVASHPTDLADPPSKFLRHRFSVPEVIDDSFRRDVQGFHFLTKSPCYPVVFQHERYGATLVFVSPKELPDVLEAFSSLDQKGMPEEETDLDALLDPQCLRDESAIFEDVIKRLEESGCPSPLPGCASMHPGRGPLLEAEGLAKPSGLDPSLGPAFPDSVEEPMLHLDLDSSLYSPSPEHSVDTFSPSDVPSDAASLTSSSLCVKKDTTWSDSLSSNGSPMETDSLDLHLSGEDCSQLICEDLPLIGSREALWFTTVAENVSCEPIEAPSGKKVKNWLMNETTLTAAVSPERLSRDTIEPMPRFVVPALSPGKKAPVKMASKPAKSRSRPVPAKLRNGMKKPFSKNVILGQTYPFSGTDIDWRLKARLSAELRGTGNFITPKQVMPARKEVPKENATQKPVVQLARVEQKGPIHQVQHVLRSPVAQIVKVMPAKQLPAAKDVKTGSPVYFRALAPKAIPAKRAADLKAGDLVAAVGKKLKLPAASAPPPHPPPPPPPLVSAAIQTPASLGKPVKTSGEFLCALSVNEARKTNVSRPAGVISMDQLTTVNGRRALGDGTVTGGLLLVNVLLSGNSAECASATSGVSTRNVREGVVEIGRLGKSFSTSLLQPEMQGIPSLLEITQQDCDVNAPLSNTNGLLQGSDLLHALEMSDFTD